MANIFDNILNKAKKAATEKAASAANPYTTNRAAVQKATSNTTNTAKTTNTTKTTNTSKSSSESIIDKVNNWMNKYLTTQGVESLPDDSKWKQISQAADNAANGTTISLNSNNIGGVDAKAMYNTVKAVNNAAAEVMNKHEEAAIAKNEEAKQNGTQNILQKANDWIWNAAEQGEQIVGKKVKESKQADLDEEFNTYIDSNTVLQKVKDDNSYASKLINQDGTLVDYEAQIKSLQNEIDKTANPYTRKTLQAQIETLQDYQYDQNVLKYKAYYDQLKDQGATEEEMNEFKNYVISQDDTGIERLLGTVGGTVESWAGSFLNFADAIYAKTARILGYDYDASNPDSIGNVLQDNAAQLLANAQTGAAGVEKDIYEIYGGIAPYLYDTALAYVTGGTSLSEMAADPKKAAQLADRALLYADVSVFGSNMKEKMDEGYDFNHAFLNSTYHAVLNHASETIFGNTVELTMDTVSGKLFQDLTDNFLLYSALTLGKQYGGEAMEEGFEGVMTPIIDDLTLNTGLTLDQYLDKNFWDDIGYQMRVGGLGGLAMGGVGMVTATINSKSDYNKVQQIRDELQELYDSDNSYTASDKAYLQNLINGYNKMLANYVEQNPYTNAFMSKADQEVVKQTAAQAKEASLAASQVDLTQKLEPIVELQEQMLTKKDQLSDTIQQKLNKEGINVSATDYVNLSSQQKIDTSLTAKYAKKLGKDVLFADLKDANGDIIDGVYVGGKTIINPNAKLGALSTLLHEYTHGTESSKYYGKLAKSVKEFFGKGYDEAIQRIKTNYSTVTNLDDAGAEKELVAITTQSLLDNYDFVNSLVRYNNDLAYKLFTDIKNLVSVTGKAESIEQNFRKAFTSIEAETSGDVDFSYVKNADIMADQKAWFENINGRKNWNKVGERFVTAEELDVAQKAMEIMAKQFQENSDLLPTENTAILGTKDGKVLLKDASYGLSVENSTKCPRTLAYDELTSLVSDEVGRPLTAVESFLVSQKLYQIAVDPQCLYCYVALDRKSYEEFVGKYIQQRDAAIAAYEAAGKPTLRNFKNAETAAANNKLFNEFLDGRKATDNMWNRYKSWITAYNNGTTLLTEYDVRTAESRSEIANAGGEQWDQLKDVLDYAQSASWAKKAYEYRAYFDEIRKLSQTQVNNLNQHYGLRWYSFNDYTPAYILENMQQFTDASMKGLKGLAYTKDTDFARIFAPTGCNINISVYVRQNADGTFEVDPVQSADLQEAIELRNQYKNVGIVATATSEAGVRWALQQDWSDVVIPFHIVRTGDKIAEYYKWTVFNHEQNDTVISKDKWKQYVDGLNKPEKKVSKMIYPSEHQNDLNTYLNLCKERGLNPRFSSFLNEGDNYMKLVNETRQSDQNTSYLKPYFDMEAAQYSFDKFKDKGGFYGGWYKEGVDLQKEANDVANDILLIEQGQKKYEDIKYGEGYVDFKEYLDMKKNRNKIAKLHGKGDVKASIGLTVSDLTNYDTAAKDGDLDVAGKIVAKVAAEKGFNQEAWHGTNNYGFRVFRTDANWNESNIGTHFGTQVAAQSFMDGESAHGDGDSGIYHVYLKANNPYETFDMFAQENCYIAMEAYELAKELDTPEAEQVIAYVMDKYHVTENDVDDAYEYGDENTAVGDDGVERDLNYIVDKKLYQYLADMVKANGYDSMAYENNLEDDGEIDYVILDPQNIKSADPVTYDEDGNMIPLEERFDISNEDIYYSKGISLEDIQNYKAAAEANDEEAAQAIVDRVAAENGYEQLGYHGTHRSFTEFRDGKPIWISKKRSLAEGYAEGWSDTQPEIVMNLYAKLGNVLDLTNIDINNFVGRSPKDVNKLAKKLDMTSDELLEIIKEYSAQEFINFVKLNSPNIFDHFMSKFDMNEYKNDSSHMQNQHIWDFINSEMFANIARSKGYDTIMEMEQRGRTYGILNKSNVKSADPFTYDDQGNLIPLDQRFNSDNGDIRYSKGVSLDDIMNYEKAAKAGDEETAQAIVDRVAAENDYDTSEKVYHGTDYDDINVFTGNPEVVEENGRTRIKGYFSNLRGYSEQYGNNVHSYYLKNGKYLYLEGAYSLDDMREQLAANGVTDVRFNDAIDGEGFNDWLEFMGYEVGEDFVDPWAFFNEGKGGNITERIQAAGYDGITWKEGSDETGDEGYAYMPFKSEDIKSADPFVYDNDGKLIPIDQRFNDKSEDVRYSRGVTLDSLGKELTPNQKFYFANSKAVDENGNLLRFYHGTSDDFTVFDPNKIGSHGAFEGTGFNFTPSKSRAEGYSGIGGKGRVMEGYLNITNPLSSTEKTMSINDLANLIKKADPTGDNIISGYAQDVTGYGTDEFVNREALNTAKSVYDYAENDVDIYSYLSSAAGGSIDLMNAFKELGYDGLIHYYDDGKIQTAVIFDSNQFKNVDNLNPTSDPDIRFSFGDEVLADRIKEFNNKPYNYSNALDIVKNAFDSNKPLIMQSQKYPNWFIGLFPNNLYEGVDVNDPEGWDAVKGSKYRTSIFAKTSEYGITENSANITECNDPESTLNNAYMLAYDDLQYSDWEELQSDFKFVDPETSEIMYSKGMTLDEIKKDNEYTAKAQSVVDKVNELNGEGGIITIEDINDILSQTNWGKKAWRKQEGIDSRKFDAIEKTKKVMIEEAPNWIKGYDTIRAEYPMFSDDTFNNAMYETLIYGELTDTTREAMKNTIYSNLDLVYNYSDPNTNVRKLMGIDQGVMAELDNFVKESLNTFENEAKYQAGDYDKQSLKKSMTKNKGFESKNIEGFYQKAKAGTALDQLAASIKKDLQAYWQPVVDQLYKSDLVLRETKGKRSDKKVSNWKTIDQNIFEIANGNKELYDTLKKQIRYEMLDTAAAAKVDIKNAAQKDVIDKVKELGIKEGSKEDIALQYYMEGHTEKKRTDLKIDGDTTKETLEEYKRNPYEKYTLDDLKKEFDQDAANGKKVWENIVEAAGIMRNGYDQTYSDIVASQTAANGDIEGKAEAEIAEKLAELNKAKLAMDNVIAEIKKNGSKESTQAAFEINKRKYNKVLNEYNTLVDKNSSNDLTRRNLTPYRENYVHHIIKNSVKDDFNSVVHAENNIPTELAGTSDFTNPNTAWSSFSMAQEGGRYTPTALGSYAAYMDEAANVLAYNPVILSIRQLNKDIKAVAKDNELSRLSEYLNDYANMLAGKRDSLDRGVQKLVGPQGMMAIRKLNSYAKAAALTGNIKSGLTQFANIPNGMAILENNGGKGYVSDMANGIMDWIKTWHNDSKTAIDQSSFMTNRYFGFDTGKTGFGQTIKNATDWMLTKGDKIGAETIWWSAYEQGVRLQEQTKVDPILYADDVTRSAIAGRTKEDMALAMQSQTINLLLPFQVENNNLFQTLKQQGSSKHLGAIATYNVAAFIFNMIMKALIGNDDEILPDVITPFYKEIKKQVEGEQETDETATNILMGEVAEFVSLLPYGSTAVQLMFGNDSETVFGDYDPNRYGATNIGLSGLGNVIKDMKKHEGDGNQQLLDIFDNLFEGYVKGGKQIMRTVEGLQSMGGLPDYKGGEIQISPVNYTTSGENISYVNNQDNILDWIRAALFGKWNTSEAQEYLDNDYSYLSKSAKNVFDTLESSTEGSTYDNYKAAKEYQANKKKDSTEDTKETVEASTEEEPTLREQLMAEGKYESYKDSVRDAYDEYLKEWYTEKHDEDDSPKSLAQFANSYGITSDDLKQDTYGSFYKQYSINEDAQKTFSEALEIENTKNALNKTISNSANTQRRVIYEELGIYDQILEFIEENGLEYSDFGLSKTVVEYDQEDINKMLAKIAGAAYDDGSGNTSTTSAETARKKQKKAMQKYMSAITSANKNIFSNISNMTSVADAKSNVKKIMQDAYKG